MRGAAAIIDPLFTPDAVHAPDGLASGLPDNLYRNR